MYLKLTDNRLHTAAVVGGIVLVEWPLLGLALRLIHSGGRFAPWTWVIYAVLFALYAAWYVVARTRKRPERSSLETWFMLSVFAVLAYFGMPEFRM